MASVSGWDYTRVYNGWKHALLSMSDEELRAITQAPAEGHVRGWKAAAKRLLVYREQERLEALRAPQRPLAQTSFKRCLACGGLMHTASMVQGYCKPCFAADVVWTPQDYIRAGEELPAAEVFTRAEIKRLDFVKFLVSNGRVSES